MVSIKGSASATPRPRRQVRRVISRLLRMGCISLAVEATMGERIAGHDADDESLHAIAVFGDGVGQLIDDDLVVAFQLAAERISQQFTGQVAAEIIRARGDDPLEFPRGAETATARQLAGGIDCATGVVDVAPAANGVEVLQTEADRIEHLVAIGAYGVGAMQPGALA